MTCCHKETSDMSPRLKLTVIPALPKSDRKSLTAYVQGLRRERPGYFIQSKGKFSFTYRDSKVIVHIPEGFKP